MAVRQKDGIFRDPEPDKTRRVLNYPGLQYFYEKLKNGELEGGGHEWLDNTELAVIFDNMGLTIPLGG